MIFLSAASLGASVIVTSVKPTDSRDAELWAAEAGRDVRLFKLGVDRLNPLAHEQRRSAGRGDLIERLTDMILLPLRRQQQGGTSSDPYWYSSGAQLVRNLSVIFVLGKVMLSYKLVYDTLLSLPQDEDDIHDPEWQESCPAFAALQAAIARTDLSEWEQSDLDGAARFFLTTIPRMPSRTLMSSVSTLTSSLDPFVRGVIGATLNGDRDTWTPEEVVNTPTVFIMDMPMQTNGPAAATVQRILLSTLQESVLRRTGSMHPVVFMCDEYANYVAPEDAAFMRTARDRVSFMCVAIQSISSLEQALSQARDPKAAAVAILSLPSVRIMCACNDVDTNQHMSRALAQTLQPKVSFGNQEKHGRKENDHGGRSASYTRDFAPDTPEITFLEMKTGSKRCNYEVEAIVSVAGRLWSNSKPSLKVTFYQRRP